MNISEVRESLRLLTELVEGAAENVIDMTNSTGGEDQYEFIGFASRKNVLSKNQATDQEEAFKLLDNMQSALASRMAGKAVSLVWRLKPELIIGLDGMRIGCRLRIKAAIVKPKLIAVQ